MQKLVGQDRGNKGITKGKIMAKKNKKRSNKKQAKVVVEQPTVTANAQQPKKGCTIPLVGGCLVPIMFSALVVLSVRECKRSGVILEQEQIKLQQMKDGTLVHTETIKTISISQLQEFQKVR